MTCSRLGGVADRPASLRDAIPHLCETRLLAGGNKAPPDGMGACVELSPFTLRRQMEEPSGP